MLKELLYTGFLHGDELTVNGKTVAENLQQVAGLSELGAQVSFLFGVWSFVVLILVYVHG